MTTSPPIVYFTSDISPAGLLALYERLGVTPVGKVAVKISTGEPPASHYLAPELIKDLVQQVNGTIVECNTGYPGKRYNTADHYKVAEQHGFTAIAPVQILDEDGEISLPVANGKRLTEDIVGKAFADYDSHVVLSHFKGHQMGGFGGALKNMSIGYASSAGKLHIHAGGVRDKGFDGEQDAFLESMAEAAKAVADAVNGTMIYFNVLNQISIDCDCNGHAAPPKIADIGMAASLDPVALDQACIDLVWDVPGNESLLARVTEMNGLLTLAHAEKIGLGSRAYELVHIDN